MTVYDLSGDQIAAEAAAAATTGGTAQGAHVVKEVAKLTPELRHGRFQALAAQTCLESLKLYEQGARECISLILRALQESEVDLVCDAAWTLHMLCQKCAVTRQYVKDANGLASVHHAMNAHPDNENIVLCSTWIVHGLAGLEGLLSLLGSQGHANLGMRSSVVAAIVWVMYEIAKERTKAGKQLQVDMPALLPVILGHLAHRSNDTQVVESCCLFLEALIVQSPETGKLFVDVGGTPHLVHALSVATSSGAENDTLVNSCVTILGEIAHGSSEMRNTMCQHGTPQALLQLSFRGQGNSAEENAMYAFGQLMGLQAVLKAISLAPSPMAPVIIGGLSVIPELVRQLNDVNDVQCLPELLDILMKVLEGLSDRGKKECISAISSVTMALAPHVEPKQLPMLDKAMQLLIRILHAAIGEERMQIAETVVETLGRVALANNSWRECLRSGFLEQLQSIIRNQNNQRRLMKYCFWCAAALSGQLFISEELHTNAQSAEVVDAAFCAMIDILDDDIEGEWVLRAAERSSEVATLRLVAEAMRQHTNNRLIQSRGCHCLALLIPLASSRLAQVPSEITSAILVAMRLHSKDIAVMRDASCAIRALIESSFQAQGAYESLSQALRKEGVHSVVASALIDFNFTEVYEPVLIEDAVVVLSALDGIESTLQALLKAGPGLIRTNGVKALFELGRQQPSRLLASVHEVGNAVRKMLDESPGEEELERNAELLIGFCRHITS